ncbi:MAG: hypothetical protein A2010_18565 [Nitrospirae bacterium GWD2_57_9]|nr:MAG: hypothetical protein A2010_18565 [Nitrospirae bacterium GWD2_57_9]OGW48568.1 MAG: hypothetical protein A2078_00440 [Nitrospirae bacterium GWC2_57_9]
MIIYEILAVVAVITFVIYAVFNIIYLIDLRKTTRALRDFIAKTDENLNPALVDLKIVLKDVRKVTGDIAALSDRLRTTAGAIVTVEKAVQHVYGYYREGLSQSANANLAAVKAGLRAGVVSLVRNLKTKKEASS